MISIHRVSSVRFQSQLRFKAQTDWTKGLLEQTLTRTYPVTQQWLPIWNGQVVHWVLGTPSMLALMEGVNRDLIVPQLSDGLEVVGRKMEISHLKPAGLGDSVTVKTTVKKARGPLLVFDETITRHSDHQVIGTGTITMAVVNKNVFDCYAPPPGLH